MRIWIINHYASPPIYPGGTRHYNLALQLQKKGHEVTIIAANYNHFLHEKMNSTASICQLDTTYQVPFIWLSVPPYKGNTIGRFYNMLVFSWRLMRNDFLKTIPSPDIIIGSTPHLFAALGAEILARKLKKPFILEIRDLWPESLVDLGRFSNEHPLIKIMKWIEHYLYKRASRIISLLPNANNYLIECGVNPNHILWLPNAVDIEAMPVLPSINNDKFTVMYAGAHGVANDLDTVISSAKILQDKGFSEKIKISLVGEGPEKLRLKKLAESYHLNIIEFLDAVPKNEIYATLNKADTYLMSLKDSPVFRWGISPNKLFDYLAMERPVIFAVNTPFNPVEQCHAGITVKPGDPVSLSDAIIKLASLSREELNDMGRRGKEYILNNHHVMQLADSLERLIMSINGIKS
jgi:glycosyltransferase involved in cell wall biosynthesis